MAPGTSGIVVMIQCQLSLAAFERAGYYTRQDGRCWCDADKRQYLYPIYEDI
jgi:hypothetical protein